MIHPNELDQQIDNLRTLQQSESILSDYVNATLPDAQAGKNALAAAITAKGVPTEGTDTLAHMAENTVLIQQETYQINGGEMYEKQLFGSLDTPNYWNLYEIMAQLLSDGRLVNYGGILLAEYYKGYDSLALSGAGAGGAYVVSDKDGDGNFIMYTSDTTHIWNDNLNNKGNRWVAYCFADEYHNFEITDTNTSPRIIHIGRKVGKIKCLANTRTSQIIVTDGNELQDFDANGFTAQWDKRVVIRVSNNQGTIFNGAGNTESIYAEIGAYSGTILYTTGTLPAAIFQTSEIVAGANAKKLIAGGGTINYMIVRGMKVCSTDSWTNVLIGTASVKNLIMQDLETQNGSHVALIGTGSVVDKVFLPAIEEAAGLAVDNNNNPSAKYVYIGYKTNDRTKSVVLKTVSSPSSNLVDIELKDGYKKNLSVSAITSVLTAENIALHMLDRLADNTDGATLTLTIGATNLNRILADDTYATYVAAAQAKNWTIA